LKSVSISLGNEGQGVTYVFVVPHFTERGEAVVCAVLTSSRSVVSWPIASDERHATVVLEQDVADCRVGVPGLVGRRDLCVLKPFECRESLVVLDGRFEEIHNFFVFAVHGPVAWHVEGGEAGGVLAKLVAPKAGVVLLESNPISVHVVEQITTAKGLKEGADAGAVVWRNKCAVGKSIGGVWRGNGVILTGQITVLCV
jgi:hypothetical protein